MTRKRALLAAVSALALVLAGSLGGCAAPGQSELVIAIAAPGEGDDAWGAGIDELRSQFESAGYRVEVRRSGDDIPTQLSQVDELIATRPEALVVAPIDGTSLGSRVERAAAAEVPVIAYDRPIWNVDGVAAYVAFDHELAGRLQAQSLLRGLGLVDDAGEPVPDAPAGPFSVELFAGDLADVGTAPMYDGAVEVLTPNLKKGTLVVPSGAVQLEDASPTHGDPAEAAARIRDLVLHGEQLDGVLSPNDAMSLAVIEETSPATVVTGCGARSKAIEAIEQGTQFSTLLEDPRELARAVVEAVSAVVTDEVDPSWLLTDTGVAFVPTRLVEPRLVDAQHLDLASTGASASCVRPGTAR